MRILRRLFTPKEAELAVHLTLLNEEPRVLARRAGQPVGVVARRDLLRVMKANQIKATNAAGTT